MSLQLLSIAMLVGVFVIATFLNVHMGALAFVATFVVGFGMAGMSEKEILSGFPPVCSSSSSASRFCSRSPKSTAPSTGWSTVR